MRLWSVVLVLLALVAPGSPAAAGSAPDALAAARRFYNLGQYDQALAAAAPAVSNPATASAAHLVIGRIRLERYRQSTDAQELDEARTNLRAVDPRPLDPRERLELQVGLAELLYFDERFGAAAELLAPVLESTATLAPDAHDRAVEWWAMALNRQAQGQPPAERGPVYQRLIDRMEQELRRDPTSAAAGYWLVAAARATGDLERAWSAALAAWIRAGLSPDRATALRADLDKLVTEDLIPERAGRTPSRDRRQVIAAMTADWEAFKKSW
jgi:hypothetical protein